MDKQLLELYGDEYLKAYEKTIKKVLGFFGSRAVS